MLSCELIGELSQSIAGVWMMEPHFAQVFARRVQMVLESSATVEAAAKSKPASDLPMTVLGRVAIVHIMGPMVKRGGWWTEFLGLTSTQSVQAAIEQAVSEKKRIVLHIDSPGGLADGTAELGDAVYAARDETQVVAQADGIMASAAYYVGSQAKDVYAQRMDLVGSLGVKMVMYDMSEMAKQDGIKVIPIDSSPKDRPFKSAGEPGTKVTDQQIDYFQGIVDSYADDFSTAIVRGRGTRLPSVDAVFDGRVFSAQDAQANGLIDGIRTLKDTVKLLRGNKVDERQLRMAIATAKARRARLMLTGLNRGV